MFTPGNLSSNGVAQIPQGPTMERSLVPEKGNLRLTGHEAEFKEPRHGLLKSWDSVVSSYKKGILFIVGTQ